MLSSYKILTKVTFYHDYNRDTRSRFTDKRYSDTIPPMEEWLTASFLNSSYSFARLSLSAAEDVKLQRMGLIFKPARNGFSIFYDATLYDRDKLLNGNLALIKDKSSYLLDSEQALEKATLLENDDILNGVTIQLQLAFTDQDFYNYTSPGDTAVAPYFSDIPKSVFYFTNSKRNLTTGDNSAFLHANRYAGKSDLRPTRKYDPSAPEKFDAEANYPDVFFSKPAGIMKLKLLPGLMDNYSVNFNCRSSLWRYIIVSQSLDKKLRDLLDSASKPAILSKAGALLFSGPEDIAVTGGEKRLAFTSMVDFPTKFFIRDSLLLTDNYNASTKKYSNVIFSDLPIPDVRSISRYSLDNNNNSVTEIFL